MIKTFSKHAMKAVWISIAADVVVSALAFYEPPSQKALIVYTVISGFVKSISAYLKIYSNIELTLALKDQDLEEIDQQQVNKESEE